MKKNYKIVFYPVALAFFIALFLTVLDLRVMNRNFYWREYSKLNHTEELNISDTDLRLVTEGLLEYIVGKRDNLDMIVTIGSDEVEMFNQREKDHMVDVQKLYLDAMKVKWFCWGAVVVGLAVEWYFYKKEVAYLFSTAIIKVFYTLMGVLFALGVYALLDFQNFWLDFHYVFFTNDLFLLNPLTDRLIQLVPSQFFFDMVFDIAIYYVISCTIVIGFAYKLRRIK